MPAGDHAGAWIGSRRTLGPGGRRHLQEEARGPKRRYKTAVLIGCGDQLIPAGPICPRPSMNHGAHGLFINSKATSSRQQGRYERASRRSQNSPPKAGRKGGEAERRSKTKADWGARKPSAGSNDPPSPRPELQQLRRSQTPFNRAQRLPSGSAWLLGVTVGDEVQRPALVGHQRQVQRSPRAHRSLPPAAPAHR